MVGLRDKLRRGKKLSTPEREFYKKNRALVDFKRVYTEEEEDFLNKWIGKA